MESHVGQHLANGSKGVTHRFTTDFAGRNVAPAVSMCK